MKIKLKLLILTTLLFVANKLLAQVVFEENIVTTIDTRSSDVHLRDIDNDGDLDLITANERGFVTLQRNTDGFGSFGSIETITDDIDGIFNIAISDLDNDDDLDIVAAGRFDDKVSWYENTDGFGSFGPEQIIIQNIEGPEAIAIGDIDGDGDNDLVISDIFENFLISFENIDGQGTFGSQQIIDNSTESIKDIKITDIDNNGTLDLLVVDSVLDRISWYPNDGLGNFSDEIIISSAVDAPYRIEHIDVNSDGNPDIISASQVDEKIAWYENLGENGNYGSQQVISSNFSGVRHVIATDIDNDNDNDIIAAGVGNSRLSYFENIDGLGDFSTENTIKNTSRTSTAIAIGDIDADSDIDIVLSVFLGTDLFWFRNNTVLSTETFVSKNDINIFPNPAKNIIYINGLQKTANYTIYNILGQTVSNNILTTQQNIINIENFQPGIYIIKIEKGRKQLIHKIIKQ